MNIGLTMQNSTISIFEMNIEDKLLIPMIQILCPKKMQCDTILLKIVYMVISFILSNVHKFHQNVDKHYMEVYKVINKYTCILKSNLLLLKDSNV